MYSTFLKEPQHAKVKFGVVGFVENASGELFLERPFDNGSFSHVIDELFVSEVAFDELKINSESLDVQFINHRVLSKDIVLPVIRHVNDYLNGCRGKIC